MQRGANVCFYYYTGLNRMNSPCRLDYC